MSQATCLLTRRRRGVGQPRPQTTQTRPPRRPSPEGGDSGADRVAERHEASCSAKPGIRPPGCACTPRRGARGAGTADPATRAGIGCAPSDNIRRRGCVCGRKRRHGRPSRSSSPEQARQMHPTLWCIAASTTPSSRHICRPPVRPASRRTAAAPTSRPRTPAVHVTEALRQPRRGVQTRARGDFVRGRMRACAAQGPEDAPRRYRCLLPPPLLHRWSHGMGRSCRATLHPRPQLLARTRRPQEMSRRAV